MLRLDTDAGETVWHGDRGDDGINWRGEGEGDNQAPGTYTVEVEHVPSGATSTLTFTVEVMLIGGGPDVTMTVRGVTITPAHGD